MDPAMLNYPAIVVAAISAFVIGGLWYSPPLFGKGWMRANNFSDDDLKRGSPAMIYGVALVLTLIISFNLAMFLNDPSTTLVWGLTAGILAGIWAAAGLSIVALFERRPLSYHLINDGYLLVAFGVMGLILGAWR